MKSIKITLSSLLCLGACMSVNAFAVDTSGAAQLDTNIPQQEGALPSDQTPPISSKPAVGSTQPNGQAPAMNPPPVNNPQMNPPPVNNPQMAAPPQAGSSVPPAPGSTAGMPPQGAAPAGTPATGR